MCVMHPSPSTDVTICGKPHVSSNLKMLTLHVVSRCIRATVGEPHYPRIFGAVFNQCLTMAMKFGSTLYPFGPREQMPLSSSAFEGPRRRATTNSFCFHSLLPTSSGGRKLQWSMYGRKNRGHRKMPTTRSKQQQRPSTTEKFHQACIFLVASLHGGID